jgi:hypothetical protein
MVAFHSAWSDAVAPLFLIDDADRYPFPLAMATIRQRVLVSIRSCSCSGTSCGGFMAGALKG